MSDPERPRHKPLDAPIDPAEQGPITGSFQVPMTPAMAFEEPLSHEISVFLTLAAKATKGLRVYAANNEALKRYVDDAYRALTVVLDRAEEITLNVREDKLLHGKDLVHQNPDREESIPYIFYRNAFRRIVLVRGMTREELVLLLSAVIADYGGFDYAGEDLVTALWRISLPHLRYLTIDAMTIDAKSAKSQSEREEIERIQADIEGIVAQIYKNSATEEDIVAGVSITKEDLEALKEIRQETDEDLDALDVATARAIANIEDTDLETLNASLLVESRDSLTTKLLDILIIVAFKEQSAAESVMTMELIQQLFDALLVSQRYGHATHLVKKLREHSETADNLKEKHIATHLLRMFATESRVVPLLNTFNDDLKSKSIAEISEFLRALGAPIVQHLLAALDFLNSPAHRRLISDLVLEHGIPDRKLLIQRMQGAKWFLARDILHIGSKLPLNELSPLIDLGLKHEHPKVREYAVGLLRPYGRGGADRLVAERLLDDDLDVRLSAIRVAAARRTPDTRASFEVLLEREDLPDREPRELRLLMAAYATICGSDAVPLLDKILAPSLFGRSRYADAQIAAAFALASIGTLAATSALQRGTRTLNTKVREACKKALAGAFERSPASQLSGSGTGDLPAAASPIPAARTDTHPVPQTRPPSLEGTPVTNRSAKSLGISVDAPEFNAAAPIEEKKREQHPQFATGPALGRVHAVHSSREEIPVRVLLGTAVPLESTSPNVHDPSEAQTFAGPLPRTPREDTPIPLGGDALTPLETPNPPLVIARGKPLDELDTSEDEALEIDVFMPPQEDEEETGAMPGAFELSGSDEDESLELDFDRGPVFPSEPSPPPGDVDLELELETAQLEVRAQAAENAKAPAYEVADDVDLELDADAFEEIDPTPNPPPRLPAQPPPRPPPQAQVPPPSAPPRPQSQVPPPSASSPSLRTPPVRVVTGRPVAAPPELDLDLDGFAHPLGSRPAAASPKHESPLSEPLGLPQRPLPSFHAPSRTTQPPPSANMRGAREVMPALPDIEPPTVVREAHRPQDRVNIPSKRGPQPPPQPAAPARATQPPPPARPSIPPPATPNPGLVDDLFLDQPAQPTTPPKRSGDEDG